MPCPRCGKDTPGDSFCSITCMKLYDGKKIDEEAEFKKIYDSLEDITNEFTECPFCRIRLKVSKPKLVEHSDAKYIRNKYCPRCYRVFGHLVANTEDAEDWEFIKVPFEDAKQMLNDLLLMKKEDENKGEQVNK